MNRRLDVPCAGSIPGGERRGEGGRIVRLAGLVGRVGRVVGVLGVWSWVLGMGLAGDGGGVAGGPTVGMEGRLEVVIGGGLLEARPVDAKAPIWVRVAGARGRGGAIEYDLRYIGLVPGRYDLRTNLVRVDGSSLAGVPAMPVRVAGLLPRPHSGELALAAPRPIPLFGTYGRLMVVLGVGWVLGLGWLVVMGRRGRRVEEAAPVVVAPTLAERLCPLVEEAAAGRLSADGQAQLERMLWHYWRERLGIEAMEMSLAVERLRAHPEAGALLRELEGWLHRRPGEVRVDVEALLAPYRGLEVEGGGAGEAGREGGGGSGER